MGIGVVGVVSHGVYSRVEEALSVTAQCIDHGGVGLKEPAVADSVVIHA